MPCNVTNEGHTTNGAELVIDAVGSTSNGDGLSTTELSARVTCTSALVAPTGTVTVRLESSSTVGAPASTDPNATSVAPVRPLPPTWTVLPTIAADGATDVTLPVAADTGVAAIATANAAAVPTAAA